MVSMFDKLSFSHIPSITFSFLPTESNNTNEQVGFAIARGTPGNPPPVPISEIELPVNNLLNS